MNKSQNQILVRKRKKDKQRIKGTRVGFRLSTPQEGPWEIKRREENKRGGQESYINLSFSPGPDLPSSACEVSRAFDYLICSKTEIIIPLIGPFS